MGSHENTRGTRIDAWLAAGGTVLAATERAARSVAAAHHAAQQAKGRTAWLTPAVFAWESWVRDRWLERNHAGNMLLNPLQEQSLWAQVVGKSLSGHGLLHPFRLAAAAQQAYRLLCAYAPNSLPASSRLDWAGDAAVFSDWLGAFDARCRRDALISSSRLALELTAALRKEAESPASAGTPRPALLLVGFDRLLETQQSLLNAWGEWRQNSPGEAAQSVQFLAAPDAASEVEACVRWLHARLAADPESRLMLVTPALQQRRGQIERALLDAPRLNDRDLDFEFSLGVPLVRVSLARSAILLLRWLHEPLTESELDWLISSGHNAASAYEETALAETMRDLRRCGQERPEWSLDDFAAAAPRGHGPSSAKATRSSTPATWSGRLLAARNRLNEFPARQSPLQWATVAAELLEIIGWPGYRPLASVSFQARERWQKVLEECASLGFDGSLMGWPEFVSTVTEAVSSTIFAAESSEARIQITEPLESAGQSADGIWFLGAEEENWPAPGQPDPLLPATLQRESAMPHASPQQDWDLAHSATLRLLGSAPEVVFSFARHSAEAEARPSRLVLRTAGEPHSWPDLSTVGGSSSPAPLTEVFEDASHVPFPLQEIRGGAAILTSQSQCPFQAFATSRLNAEHWEPAEPGLTPRQRGQLLHSVLGRVWSGSAHGGISTLAELQSITDLHSWAHRIVRAVLQESLNPERRNSLPARFPSRYLDLEAERLTTLVSQWLEYERQRLPFTVLETEQKHEVSIAGLKLTLRLDRLDRLDQSQTGGRLIVDYKSSEVGPKAWTDPRPDDVQLPLYAAFAARENIEGLAFARVRPGDVQFYGRVREAAGSLLPGLNRQNSLMKNPLTDLQLEDWRDTIEQLARDFLAGKATVDPKDPARTCATCHLHAVCRIYENQPFAALDENVEESADSDQENAGGGDD